MFLQNVIGQNSVKKIFDRATNQNKLASAYLFVGDEGVGKDYFALELAKLLNCENINSNFENPCNECKSCKLANEFSHPNIQYIFALPPGKTNESKEDPLGNLSDEIIESIKDNLNLKKENPYHKMKLPNANLIKIQSIREIKRKFSLSAQREGKRVVIISESQNMNVESSNAFLKTLEEPPANSLLILTSSKQFSILQTIKSRCQIIKFSPLEKSEIQNFLIDKYKISLETSSLPSMFAEGSITRAMDFMDGNIIEVRNEFIDLLRTSLKGKNYISDLSNKIQSIVADKNKNKIQFGLKLINGWLRDSLILREKGDINLITNLDDINTLEKFSNYYRDIDYDKLFLEISTAQERVLRNVSLQMILTSMLLKIRQICLKLN